MAENDPNIPGIEVPIKFEGVGISETEKEMSEFLDKTEKRTRKLKDTQEKVNEGLNEEIKLRKKASDTGEGAEVTTTKLLKKHRDEGKKILGDSLKQYKMSKDPAVLKRMKTDLAAWEKKGKSIENQAELETAMMKGDAKKVSYLMDEMNLLSGKEKVQQRLGVQLKNEAGAVQGMLKGAAGAIPVIGAALAGGALIEGLVSAVKQAANAYLEWQRGIVQLNEVFDGNQKLMKVAEDTMEGFGTQLGITRGELAGMVKQGLQLKVQTMEGEDGFKKWTKSTMLLHKATGLALQSSGDLLNTVAFRYGVGVRGIRDVAAAFTHVTKTSRISADELASYTKSLEGFFLQFPKLSGDAKGKMTEDMMGIAGAIANVGGDPQIAGQMFSKMRKNFDEQGWVLAAQIAKPFGQTARDIKAQLETGDVEGVFEKLVVGLNKMAERGPKALEAHAMALGDAMGLPYEEMLKWQKMGAQGAEGFKKYMAEMRSKAKDQEAFAKAAKDTTAQIDQMVNAVKNSIAQVWRVFGKEIIGLAQEVLPSLVRKLIDLVKWFRGSGKDSVVSFFVAIKQVGSYLVDIFGPVVRDIHDAWKGISAIFQEVTKTLGAFGIKGSGSMQKFGASMMMNVIPGLNMIKPMASVFRTITKAIEAMQPYLDRFRKSISDEVGPVVSWIKGILNGLRDAFDDVRDAIDNWIKSSPIIQAVVSKLGKVFGFVKDVLWAVKETLSDILGLIGKVLKFTPMVQVMGSLVGRGGKSAAVTDKDSAEWVKNILSQASTMDAAQAKKFVENALQALPRKEQRRAKADPAIQAVLEGKGAQITPVPGEAGPQVAMAAGPQVPLYAESPMPGMPSAPKINFPQDKQLFQETAKQTNLLADIKDILGRGGKGQGPGPVGTSLALSSMG